MVVCMLDLKGRPHRRPARRDRHTAERGRQRRLVADRARGEEPRGETVLVKAIFEVGARVRD